jgi:hypothetical protein
MARPASDNTTAVWKFLRGKGFTPAQTAGIIGGLKGESGPGLNPSARNPSSGAIGIGQWLGGRARGVRPGDLHGQLQHLWSELQGPERGALQRVKQAHTIEGAVDAWVRGFERPSASEIASSIGSRKSMARETFNRLSGVPGAASTGGGGGSSGGSGGSTRTTTTTTPGVDNSLARLALVQSFLGNKNADVLDFAAQAKGLADVPGTTSTQTERLPGSSSGGGSGSASFSTPPTQSGVASFEGKKVAAWIKPALVYARNHGWKGQVNSGYRSFADQTRIYNSGVRPAAKPGTSNHEGTDFPRGAVDVSDAQTLARILARSPYGKRLTWAGAKDPVHFSHPHGGSY